MKTGRMHSGDPQPLLNQSKYFYFKVHSILTQMEFCLNPAETVYRSLMRETPLFGAIGCYKSHLQPALEKLFFFFGM